MSNRASRFIRYLGGHDFRLARLKGGVASRSTHPEVRDGVTCYNCGVYTTNEDWQKLIPEYFGKNQLMQCCASQMDLFGHEATIDKRRMRDRWRKV
jgi:hypothetical protein